MSSQTQFVGTGANDTGMGTVAWTDPTLITSDNGSTATLTAGPASASNYLKGTNCGFSIPSGATIDGIVVTFERGFVGDSVTDFSIRIVKGGTIGSANKSVGATWSSSMTVVSYGGASDLWSETWSVSDINASNFGAVLGVTTTGASPAMVDYMSITVYYTESGGGGGGSGSYWADAFMTFRNVAIPKGVTINKAFVRFTAKSGTGNLFTVNNTDDDVNTMIFGNDVDDSSPPTDVSSYTSKVLTSACKDWNDVPNWTDEGEYDTPNISCIIQEIVDRAGWASGNDISIYVQNNYGTETSLNDIGRRSYDYGTTPEKSPELFVYYSHDHTMTGGVVCGGSADLASFLTMNGGIVAGGSALVTTNITEHTSGSGALCSGSASDPTYVVVPRGVLAGGSATVTYSQNITVSGGVVVNGAKWKYRRTLTVPTAKVSANLDKFYLPVAVKLNPVEASSSIFVTDTNDKALAFEVRDYDAATGQLWFYVKTPLASGSNNVLWLYYGDNS